MTTRRPGKGGRPSRGDRQPLTSRMPSDLAKALIEETERSGYSISGYIASVLAEKHNPA